MSIQCKDCIHKDVCAYKEHIEDAEKTYEEVRKICGQYPWFKVEITCIQYREDKPIPREVTIA